MTEPGDATHERQALSRARSAERSHQDAYNRGKRGSEPTHDPSDETANDAYEVGRMEHQADTDAARRAAAYGPAQTKAVEIGQQGAGFLLGMITYALVLAYLDAGWKGVTGWISAKFINRPLAKGTKP